MRDEIKKLGNVNVNAIEEYKELSERHTFLSTQHADLVQAEQTLLQIIDELRNGMKECSDGIERGKSDLLALLRERKSLLTAKEVLEKKNKEYEEILFLKHYNLLKNK